MLIHIWAAPNEFGTYRLCEQRRFRRACASAQSRQNLRCSLIQAVSQEEPSDRKPDPWLLWMAGHAQLKLVMTECSKTQIRLTRLILQMRQMYIGTDSNESHAITNPTKSHVHPVKTSFSLHNHVMWSDQSPLCAQQVVKYPRLLHAKSKD